jgi:DNA-binding MarR family transcriptional regulator
MDELPPTLLGLTTYVLSKIGKTARGQMAARLAGGGQRMWHLAVLAALADFGPQAQRELATRLAIDPSDVVKVLDDLSGDVARARDPADRRRVTVTITDQGRRELDRLMDEARAAQDELLAPLDRAERAQLHALLSRVLAEPSPQ